MSNARKAVEQVLELGPGGGEVIDTLAEHGYEFDGVEARNSEFVATATKTLANGRTSQSQALGRTKIEAARSLVKVVTRP